MSQDLTTPRNIYGPRSDGDSTDSYGFPSSHSSSHSSHSSISSASTYPYYGSSVDGSSVSDYSSQSDSMEPISSRTLPRPSGLINSNLPPAPPQSMMGQFNSKISSSTQKKHKCKLCDKRFTRPSSLQTHMYSHTGEKRTSLHFMCPNKSLTFRQRTRAKPRVAADIFRLFPTSDVIAKCTRAIDLPTTVHPKDHGCQKSHPTLNITLYYVILRCFFNVLWFSGFLGGVLLHLGNGAKNDNNTWLPVRVSAGWEGEVSLSTWGLTDCVIMHCATTLEDVIRSTKFPSSMYDFWALRSGGVGRVGGFFHSVPLVIPTLALAIEFAHSSFTIYILYLV